MMEFGVVRGLVYTNDNRALFLQKVQHSSKRSSSLNTLHYTFAHSLDTAVSVCKDSRTCQPSFLMSKHTTYSSIHTL